jgi:heptaprenylglyceryl phosphate synthase
MFSVHVEGYVILNCDHEGTAAHVSAQEVIDVLKETVDFILKFKAQW